MSHKVSFTLDDEAFEIIKPARNRSALVTEALKVWKRQQFEQDMLAAMAEADNDPAYLAEVSLWDVTLNDGMTPEGRTE